MSVETLRLVHGQGSSQNKPRKKVAVFTGTKVEYGLLYWLLQDIHKDVDLELQLLVSGTHMSPEFGETYHLIEQDGLPIAAKIESLLSSHSAVGTVKSMGLGMIGVADSLSQLQPDVIVILGDRFESLAVAQSAMILGIPIVHLHGGEVSKHNCDNAIRHAITKLSDWHGTSTEQYRQRVIQLGEDPSRVKVVGALGLEHLRRSQLLSREELSEHLGFSLTRPYFMVNYQPVRPQRLGLSSIQNQSAEIPSIDLQEENPVQAFTNLLKVMDHFSGHQIIFCYPKESDASRPLIKMIKDYVQQEPKRAFVQESYTSETYLSAVSHCAAVIGNSSSALIETPSLNVPTVNIGIRQQGRLAAENVIHAQPTFNSILVASLVAIERKYPNANEEIVNPYDQGDSNPQILEMIKSATFAIKPSFYDLSFEVKNESN